MARVRAEGARAVGNFRRPCHPKGPKELSFLKGARVNTQDLTRKRPRRRLSLLGWFLFRPRGYLSHGTVLNSVNPK